MCACAVFLENQNKCKSSIRLTALNVFYLLFICSCLIVRSEIPFNESLCLIGTIQFISSVHDLTRFFLICIFTELNLQTHLMPIIVLCIRFYNPALAIICLTTTRFSIIDVFELSRRFPVICFRCLLA